MNETEKLTIKADIMESVHRLLDCFAQIDRDHELDPPDEEFVASVRIAFKRVLAEKGNYYKDEFESAIPAADVIVG